MPRRIINVPILQLPHGATIDLPAYATSGAAGMDLIAAIEQDLTLQPMDRASVSTGIAIALPEGYEAQVRPRSGLSFKHGLTIINAPGTVDSDYRGEIQVLMINLGTAPYTLRRGDRIAQLVIQPVVIACWNVVGQLPDTERGTGGFGHTGR